MPKITYISHDGTEQVVDVDTGMSVMEGALDNDVDGIDAECGGCLSCATCHVYVDDSWLSKLPPPEDMEIEMLDLTASEKQANSRLSCQIEVTDELDGLVVRTPEFQS